MVYDPMLQQILSAAFLAGTPYPPEPGLPLHVTFDGEEVATVRLGES